MSSWINHHFHDLKGVGMNKALYYYANIRDTWLAIPFNCYCYRISSSCSVGIHYEQCLKPEV